MPACLCQYVDMLPDVCELLHCMAVHVTMKSFLLCCMKLLVPSSAEPARQHVLLSVCHDDVAWCIVDR